MMWSEKEEDIFKIEVKSLLFYTRLKIWWIKKALYVKKCPVWQQYLLLINPFLTFFKVLTR